MSTVFVLDKKHPWHLSMSRFDFMALATPQEQILGFLCILLNSYSYKTILVAVYLPTIRLIASVSIARLIPENYNTYLLQYQETQAVSCQKSGHGS